MGPDHLLLAALHEPRGPMARILSEAGIGPERVRSVLGNGTGTASDPRSGSDEARPRTPSQAQSRRRAAARGPGVVPTPHSPRHLARRRKLSWRLVLLVMAPGQHRAGVRGPRSRGLGLPHRVPRGAAARRVHGRGDRAPRPPDQPDDRRAAECDLRQRGRADHRDRGAPGGTGRPGEGVHHRQHSRQPPSHPRAGHHRRRDRPEGAALQPHQRGDELGNARARGGGAGVSGPVPRATPGGRRQGLRAQDVGSRCRRSPDHLRLLAALHAQDPPTHVRRRGPPAGRAGLERGPGARWSWVGPRSGWRWNRNCWYTPRPRPPRRGALDRVPRASSSSRSSATPRSTPPRSCWPERGRSSSASRSRSAPAPRLPCWWRRSWSSPGVLMGREMNLVFQPFEVLALGMATIVTAIITLDGESHWFEGRSAPGGLRDGGRGGLLSLI